MHAEFGEHRRREFTSSNLFRRSAVSGTSMTESPTIATWIALAKSPMIVKRALGYALVVGTLLIAINHGTCIINWEYSFTCLWQSALSLCVPFTVSTFSSVQALLGGHILVVRSTTVNGKPNEPGCEL